ncbi:MAG: class I SAM-dependent methyltransferase [Nocardioidaceae bacterium]
MTTDAGYFDQWYAAMPGSPAKDAIQQRYLGLPPELLSTSLLGWEGIAEVVAALRLPPGATLLDLACGRGGYGLEVARRTGARLVGVDFSAEAVRQAQALAGPEATFQVGDLAATGLPDASVDGVMCVDAVQFAADPAAAYAEVRRVLRPGGRVALTCWEPVDRADAQVPERLRRVDLATRLTGAGLVEVEVVERTAWTAAEHAMWEEAAALDPGDDPALRSFHEEGVRAAGLRGRLRRVLGTATRP